jgi:hypothetical protein
MRPRTGILNPTHGWIVQIQPPTQSGEPNSKASSAPGWLDVNNWGIHKRLLAADRLDLNNPHTPVWGIHKRLLAAGRLDLNNPHTAVWGIHKRLLAADRLDLNNPHTPVWGIQKRLVPAGRLDLNNPPTPVGGISEPSQRRPQLNLSQNMIHEITRSEITNNISCQFVSLVRVVSWIDCLLKKTSSRKQEVGHLQVPAKRAIQ